MTTSRIPRIARISLVAAVGIAVCAAVAPVSALSASAPGTPSEGDATTQAALWGELLGAAQYTAGQAQAGFAAESSIVDQEVGVDGPPWLEVSTKVAVHDLTTSRPKVAFEREVKSYGVVQDFLPWRSETWGGVGTGAYGSGGVTQGWLAVPTNLTGPSADLVKEMGSPERIVSRAFAGSDISPASRPHSVTEAQRWVAHNGAAPWGPIMYAAQNSLIRIASVSKEVRDNGEKVYEVTWAPDYPGTLTSRSVVTADGLLAYTVAHASFPRTGDYPATNVKQEAQLTWIGAKAPMPGPALTENVVRASAFARQAAMQPLPAIVAHVNQELKKALPEKSDLMAGGDLAEVVDFVVVDQPRWFSMNDAETDRVFNDWARRFLVEVDEKTRTVWVRVEANVLSASVSCATELVIKDGRVVASGDVKCDTVPMPVLGVDDAEGEWVETESVETDETGAVGALVRVPDFAPGEPVGAVLP